MHEISCRMMQLFRRGMLIYIFFELKMALFLLPDLCLLPSLRPLTRGCPPFLLCLKQRFPANMLEAKVSWVDTGLDMSKIQYNKVSISICFSEYSSHYQITGQ